MAYNNHPPFKSQSLPLYGQRRSRIDYAAFYDQLEHEEQQKADRKMSYLCFPLIPKHARCDESSLSSDTSCSSVEYFGPSHWGAVPAKPKTSHHVTTPPKVASSPDHLLVPKSHLPRKRSNASSESLSRKEMREVVKAKVEAERARLVDSSSSDEAPSPRPLRVRYHSDEMLSRKSTRAKYVSSARLNRSPKVRSSTRLKSSSPLRAISNNQELPCPQDATPPLSWNESQLYRHPKHPFFSPEEVTSSDGGESVLSVPMGDTSALLSPTYRQPSPTYRLTWTERRKSYLSNSSFAPALAPVCPQKNEESKRNSRSASNYSTFESTVSFPSSPQDSGFSTLSVGSNPTSRAPTPPPRSPISRSRICEEILARNRTISPKSSKQNSKEMPPALQIMALNENITTEHGNYSLLRSPTSKDNYDPFLKTKSIPTGLPPKGLISQKKALSINQKLKQSSDYPPLCRSPISQESAFSNSCHKWEDKAPFSRSFNEHSEDKCRRRTSFESLNHSEFSPFKTISPQKNRSTQDNDDFLQAPRGRSLKMAKEIIDSVLQRECKRRYSENLDDAMGELERIYLCLNTPENSKASKTSSPSEECRYHPLIRCKSDSWNESGLRSQKSASFFSKTHPTKSKPNFPHCQTTKSKPDETRDSSKPGDPDKSKIPNFDRIPKDDFDVEELLKDMPKVISEINTREDSCPYVTSSLSKAEENHEDNTSPPTNVNDTHIDNEIEADEDKNVSSTTELPDATKNQKLEGPSSSPPCNVTQVWHLQIHQDQDQIASALNSFDKDPKIRISVLSDTESAYWTESESRLESLLSNLEGETKLLLSPTSPQSDSGIKGSWPSSNDEDTSFFHASPKIQLSSLSPAIFNVNEMAQPPSSKPSSGVERRLKGRGAAAGGQDEVLGELKGGGARSRIPSKDPPPPPAQIVTRSTRASRLRMQANSLESSKQKEGKISSSSHPTDVNKNVTKSMENSHPFGQQKALDKLKDKSGKRKSSVNTLGDVKDKKLDSPLRVKHVGGQDVPTEKEIDRKSKPFQYKSNQPQGSQQLPPLRRPEIPKVLQQKKEITKVTPKASDKIIKNGSSIPPSSHLQHSDQSYSPILEGFPHLPEETNPLLQPSESSLTHVSSFDTTSSLPSLGEVLTLPSTTNPNPATDQTSASPVYMLSTTYHSSIDGDNARKLSSSTRLPSSHQKPGQLIEKPPLWLSSKPEPTRTTFHKASIGTVSSSKNHYSGVSSLHIQGKSSISETKGAKNVPSILKNTIAPSHVEHPMWSPNKGSNLVHRPPPHSILKKKESFEEKEGGTASLSQGLHSILKKSSYEEDDRRSSSPEIHPILKNRLPDVVTTEDTSERKPILKKRGSLAEEPMLSHLQRVEPPKPILKKKSSTEEKPKPILKSKKSMEEFNWTPNLSSRPRANSSDTGIRSILKKAKNTFESVDDSQSSLDSSSANEERHKSRRVSLESGLVAARLMPPNKAEKNDPPPSEPFSAIVESCQSTSPCDILPCHIMSQKEEIMNSDRSSASFTDDQALRTFSLLHDPPIPNLETSSTDSNGQDPPSSQTTESSITDCSVENGSVENNPSKDSDLSNLGVMAKLRFFEQLQAKDKPLSKAKISRRQSSRFQTQPVTLEEVRIAAQMSSQQPSQENDPSRLSLKEKLKLFNEKLASKPSEEVQRSFRSKDLRRNTQPVTSFEIQQAKSLPQFIKMDTNNQTSSNDTEKTLKDTSSKDMDNESNEDGKSLEKNLKDRVNGITNSAVKRRYNAALRRKQDNRHTISSFTCISSNGTMTGERTRALTESILDGILDCPGESIAERLNQLSKNCDESWKQRLQSLKKQDLEEVKAKGEGLSSRVSQLEEAQEQWRERVQEKDAVQFTVAGKMAASSVQPTGPVVLPALSQLSSKRERRHPTPRPLRMLSSTTTTSSSSSCTKSLVINGESSSKTEASVSTSTTKITISHSSNETSIETQHSSAHVSTRVRLVQPDDEDTFQSFFRSATEPLENETAIVSEDFSLDDIASQTQLLAINRKDVKVARRKIASHNPLKTLAARTDLRQEYDETFSSKNHKEISSKSVAFVLNNHHSSNEKLALSALAGLASQEDFTNIALKKIQPAVSALLPQKDMMLLQIKGRRHVQTRLVEPTIDSLNSGDNYVLVTPSCVFNYVGPYANVIEISKGAEVASVIQANKDLCFTGNAEVVTISANHFCPDFLRHLGYNGDLSKDVNTAIRPPTSDEEDRIYEQALMDTTMIYQVEDKKLVPHPEYWGTQPSYGMLDSNQVYIFDFGSEFYIWQGKLSSPSLRKVAMQLARELWELDYDYRECGFNPLHARLEGPLIGKRPPWALFAKINQNMEPVLFREKFIDWPDVNGRLISVKKSSNEVAMEDIKTDGLYQLVACDAKDLINSQLPEPDLVLEGSHLGRGREYHDVRENRHFLIETIGVTTWLVREYDRVPLEASWNGIFYSGETYVIRWQYRIIQTAKNLTGQQSRHSTVGRERCAYYFWQGLDSTISEKGASALMTVELNEERGPHVRVVQGKEPPCFLNLFNGAMVIYSGKRDDPEDLKNNSSESKWKLLMARGEFPSEGHLVEVPCEAPSLRSRAGFLLVNLSSHQVLVWRGCAMTSSSKEVLAAAQNCFSTRLASSPFPSQHSATSLFVEMEEGLETPEFWLALRGSSRDSYSSLLNIQSSLPWRSPRLFQFSSVHGDFKATEITAPYSTRTHLCPFPFSQNDLYGAMSQPALFLVDSGADKIYLWQGWWPEGENVQPGSLRMRWAVERKCAMETALCYAQELASDLGCYLVWAGLEPVHFVSLFPDWTFMPHIAQLNQRLGRQPGELQEVSAVLQQVTRTEYSLEELLQLPPGVDPLRLESYLPLAEFEEILGLSKENFYKLPFWKQIKLKQNVGLF